MPGLGDPFVSHARRPRELLVPLVPSPSVAGRRLAGIDWKTFRRYVAARDTGVPIPARRALLVDTLEALHFENDCLSEYLTQL